MRTKELHTQLAAAEQAYARGASGLGKNSLDIVLAKCLVAITESLEAIEKHWAAVENYLAIIAALPPSVIQAPTAAQANPVDSEESHGERSARPRRLARQRQSKEQ